MQNSIVDKFLQGLGAALAPARCAFCLAPAAAPACGDCEASLPWNERACPACARTLAAAVTPCADCLRVPPPQHGSWAAFRYDAPIAQLIVKLKFHGDLASAHLLGRLMARRLARRREPLPELLIPVPLHSRRLRRRGYNQALEIARHLAAHLSIPLDAGCARRLQPTREQTELSAAQRRRNVRGVFAVGPAVCGKRIALLDDVITTGATVAELARAARAAGAAQVEVWAAARA